MKKFGIIAAVEIDAVKRRYGKPIEKINDGGFDIYHYEANGNDVYVLHSGAGEISAAAATQLLISVYHVDMILNFGVVGSLTKEMDDIRLCVVEKVVHYQFDTSEVDHCPVRQQRNWWTWPSGWNQHLSKQPVHLVTGLLAKRKTKQHCMNSLMRTSVRWKRQVLSKLPTVTMSHVFPSRWFLIPCMVEQRNLKLPLMKPVTSVLPCLMKL